MLGTPHLLLQSSVLSDIALVPYHVVAWSQGGHRRKIFVSMPSTRRWILGILNTLRPPDVSHPSAARRHRWPSDSDTEFGNTQAEESDYGHDPDETVKGISVVGVRNKSAQQCDLLTMAQWAYKFRAFYMECCPPSGGRSCALKILFLVTSYRRPKESPDENREEVMPSSKIILRPCILTDRR
jgi:hypothetical protein